MLVRAQREERLQVSGRLAGVRRREGRGDLFNTAVAEGARSQPPKPGAQPGEYPQYASTAAGGSRAQILAEAAGAPSTRLPLPRAPAPPPPHRHPLLPAPLSGASGCSPPPHPRPPAGRGQRLLSGEQSPGGAPPAAPSPPRLCTRRPPSVLLRASPSAALTPRAPCPTPARHLQFAGTESRPRLRPPRPWLPLSLLLPDRCSRPHRSAAGSERAADARAPAAGGQLCPPPRRQCPLRAEGDAINRGEGGGAPGPPAAAGDPQPAPSARRARRTAPLAGCSAELRVHGAASPGVGL